MVSAEKSSHSIVPQLNSPEAAKANDGIIKIKNNIRFISNAEELVLEQACKFPFLYILALTKSKKSI